MKEARNDRNRRSDLGFGGRTLFENVNVKFTRECVWVDWGKRGGKSTFLRCLSGVRAWTKAL